MPLYEYRCKECGEEFEKQLRFSEADELPECPACKSALTQKRLSRVTWLGPASGSGGGESSSASCGTSGGFT